MSRLASIRFTDDVLNLVDSCVEKTKGNRSSFVRDACLAHARSLGIEDASYVKLSQQNSWKLKQIASQLNTDHDELLNKLLENLFEQIGDKPFAGME